MFESLKKYFSRPEKPKADSGGKQSPLIMDLGMHLAEDTEFYLKKGFKVVAVEANPILVDQARSRFTEALESGQLRIENCGIAERPGSATFYVNDGHSEWSSFIEEIGAREGNYHEITVACKTLLNLFDEYGCPYYLKIDIEGHDWIALNAISETQEKPQYISVENGSVELLEWFHRYGYDQFKFINQAEVPDQSCPNPANEGQYVEHVFPYGASGTFGEETPGPWVDYDTIRQQVTDYWNIPNRDAVKHGWFDVHAKKSRG